MLVEKFTGRQRTGHALWSPVSAVGNLLGKGAGLLHSWGVAVSTAPAALTKALFLCQNPAASEDQIATQLQPYQEQLDECLSRSYFMELKHETLLARRLMPEGNALAEEGDPRADLALVCRAAAVIAQRPLFCFDTDLGMVMHYQEICSRFHLILLTPSGQMRPEKQDKKGGHHIPGLGYRLGKDLLPFQLSAKRSRETVMVLVVHGADFYAADPSKTMAGQSSKSVESGLDIRFAAYTEVVATALDPGKSAYIFLLKTCSDFVTSF